MQVYLNTGCAKVMNDFELALSWMFKCKTFIKMIQNITDMK
jgi:hypothetical protein